MGGEVGAGVGLDVAVETGRGVGVGVGADVGPPVFEGVGGDVCPGVGLRVGEGVGAPVCPEQLKRDVNLMLSNPELSSNSDVPVTRVSNLRVS